MLIAEVAPEVSITPSEIIEYLYCPRFIYFMNCLAIDQHEELRYKVMEGRNIHEIKTRLNKDYLRKKINCVDKKIEVYMGSQSLHIRGIVDEILFFEDGSAAPLDYKFAEFKGDVFEPYKYQSIYYGLLIKENLGVKVNRGFICYTRSNNLLKEIIFSEGDFARCREIIIEILNIAQFGYFPAGAKEKGKCIDCCYRNICVK